MALLKCIECNHEVSEFADSCPYCGCPVSMSMLTDRNDIEPNKKYSIRLSQRGTSPVKTIKKIREITGLGLAEAKKIVDDLSFIKTNCSIDEVNKIKELIESEGGTIQIIPYNSTQEKTINIPKCPTCQSTNIRRISGTKKAASIIGFGILSNNLGKTYECLNCKYKW